MLWYIIKDGVESLFFNTAFVSGTENVDEVVGIQTYALNKHNLKTWYWWKWTAQMQLFCKMTDLYLEGTCFRLGYHFTCL